ncbi:MAG: energy transducer TonB [Proteobacteria bacterium]|nr:energy transducer TonB [Pseudomonadota bacterium]
MKSSRNIYFAIIVSLVVHLLALVYHFELLPPIGFEPVTQKPEFIELSQLPNQQALMKPTTPLEKRDNQIVETEDSGNNEVDPNATLLSDKNQKAQVQTRAQRTDAFQKGGGTGPRSEEGEDSGDEAPSEESVTLDVGTSPRKKKDWKTLSLKDLSVNGDGNQASASDDYLPNVAPGERTILSTREFRYFSYYNRIKDLLRQHWKPSIEREVAKLWGKGQMLRENELVTRVLVLLDKTGQVQKISKIGASGVSEIDEVAVQAFQQASPFPNPPVGLVEADGYVRINWDFILQTAAAPQIQFRPNPNSARFR